MVDTQVDQKRSSVAGLIGWSGFFAALAVAWLVLFGSAIFVGGDALDDRIGPRLMLAAASFIAVLAPMLAVALVAHNQSISERTDND